MQVIKTWFEDKLLTCTKDPITTFSIPSYDGEFGLFAPQGNIWKQLGYFGTLQILIQCAFAAIIYSFIIKMRGTIGAYLLGWGVIIPASCILPFYLLEFLDIRNKCLKLIGAQSPTVVVFRCIEAMYDTSPSPAVEASISNYIAYYSSMVPCVWDSKTNGRKRINVIELLSAFLRLFLQFHVYSLLLSFMLHHDFKPLTNDFVNQDQFNINIDLFTPQHLVNGYLTVVIIYFHLAFGLGLMGFAVQAQGYSIVNIFRNPLFACHTPTEFWTERWNTTVHQMLKHGVFLPIQKQKLANPAISILVTFIISGLYHDYSWGNIFYYQAHYYDDNGCNSCHVPIYGRVTTFFLFTGLIMLLERPVTKLPFVQFLSQNLPLFVKSTLIVLIHAPFAHLYYGDWIQGGFFNDSTLLFWHIKKL